LFRGSKALLEGLLLVTAALELTVVPHEAVLVGLEGLFTFALGLSQDRESAGHHLLALADAGGRVLVALLALYKLFVRLEAGVANLGGGGQQGHVLGVHAVRHFSLTV